MKPHSAPQVRECAPVAPELLPKVSPLLPTLTHWHIVALFVRLLEDGVISADREELRVALCLRVIVAARDSCRNSQSYRQLLVPEKTSQVPCAPAPHCTTTVPSSAVAFNIGHDIDRSRQNKEATQKQRKTRMNL